jgi:hypothetical protein
MSATTFKANYVKQFDGAYSNALPVKGAIGDLAEYIYEKVRKNEIETVAANKTLTEDDSGKTFLCATDGVVFTLPSTSSGLRYKFINTGAATAVEIKISPAAADGISGTITLADSVVVDAGVVNKDLINTKATTAVGDTVTLVGTGTAGTKAWIIESSTGIWAAEG